MSLLSGLMARCRSWLRGAAHRDRLNDEMEAELENHLEHLTADLERSGLSREEAARQARIAMGSLGTHKEDMRASFGLRGWDEIGADLRYGIRMLWRTPGFTAIAAISLALAIGANTAIFSVAKQILYERLAVPHAENLRLLEWVASREHNVVHDISGSFELLPGGMASSNSFSYPAFQQLREDNRVLDDLFAFMSTSTNANIRGDAMRLRTEMVSGNYYQALGVRPILGRAIQPSDDIAPGQSPVAVISYGMWEREFGKSPAVVGRGDSSQRRSDDDHRREPAGIYRRQDSAGVPRPLRSARDATSGVADADGRRYDQSEPVVWKRVVVARPLVGVHHGPRQTRCQRRRRAGCAQRSSCSPSCAPPCPSRKARTFRSFGCATAAADCLSSKKILPSRWPC